MGMIVKTNRSPTKPLGNGLKVECFATHAIRSVSRQKHQRRHIRMRGLHRVVDNRIAVGTVKAHFGRGQHGSLTRLSLVEILWHRSYLSADCPIVQMFTSQCTDKL